MSNHSKSGGQLEVTEFLVRIGAEIELLDNNCFSALHYSCDEGHTKIAKLLISNGANTETKGTKYYFTPLHCASWKNHFEIVRLLIENNADAKDNYDNTPLRIACKKGYLGIVRLLVGAGSALGIREHKFGYTPLHLSCISEHLSVTKFLIEIGANTNETNKEGIVPKEVSKYLSLPAISEIIQKAATTHNPIMFDYDEDL